MPVATPSRATAIQGLIRPRSIAIVGASADLSKINGRPLKHLIDKGYDGRISAHGIAQRIMAADALATVVGLDMADAGWTPTVDNYLGRVTKPRIIEAVREAKGDATAVLINT